MIAKLLTGKGIFIVLVIAFLAVEGLVAACFLSLVHYKKATNWTAHSQNVLIELERVLSTFTEAETSQRGYVLTGLDQYLSPYRTAMDGLDRQLRYLGGLTRDNSAQSRRVAYLERQMDQRSLEMDRAIIVRRTEGLAAAKSVVADDTRQETKTLIHGVVGQMRTEEQQRLEDRRADSRTWAFITGSFAIALFLVTALVFALCGIVIKMALTAHGQA